MNSECKNSPGKYECHCNKGYIFNSSKSGDECVDFDECSRFGPRKVVFWLHSVIFTSNKATKNFREIGQIKQNLNKATHCNIGKFLNFKSNEASFSQKLNFFELKYNIPLMKKGCLLLILSFLYYDNLDKFLLENWGNFNRMIFLSRTDRNNLFWIKDCLIYTVSDFRSNKTKFEVALFRVPTVLKLD